MIYIIKVQESAVVCVDSVITLHISIFFMSIFHYIYIFCKWLMQNKVYLFKSYRVMRMSDLKCKRVISPG